MNTLNPLAQAYTQQRPCYLPRQSSINGRMPSDFEAYYVLIDYRDGNKRLKRTAMTADVARSRNDTLAGTGLAWAKSYE